MGRKDERKVRPPLSPCLPDFGPREDGASTGEGGRGGGGGDKGRRGGGRPAFDSSLMSLIKITATAFVQYSYNKTGQKSQNSLSNILKYIYFNSINLKKKLTFEM